MMCIKPYSKRVDNMSVIMKKLREIEKTHCPRIPRFKEKSDTDIATYSKMMDAFREQDLAEEVIIQKEDESLKYQCQVCCEEVRFTEGLQCKNEEVQHFICDDCFSGVNMRHQLATENRGGFLKHNCFLVCPTCLSSGQTTIVSDIDSARHLSKECFCRYMAIRQYWISLNSPPSLDI
jgi:hypothetical protein